MLMLMLPMLRLMLLLVMLMLMLVLMVGLFGLLVNGQLFLLNRGGALMWL